MTEQDRYDVATVASIAAYDKRTERQMLKQYPHLSTYARALLPLIAASAVRLKKETARDLLTLTTALGVKLEDHEADKNDMVYAILCDLYLA